MKYMFSFLLMVMSLLTFNLTALSRSPYFDRLIPRSGALSFSHIHCIFQDRQGFIWITSPNGLARFDGNDFLMFQHRPNQPGSLIDNYLFSVLEDSSKNLWVTTDKGLELLDKKTGTFIHFQHDPKNPNSLPSNRLRSIAEDKDGNLWIGTIDTGLCQFDYTNGTFFRFIHDPSNSNSPSSNSIWAIYCDETDRIWVGTHEGSFDCYDRADKKWLHFNLLAADRPLFGDANIWDIIEGKDGNIWLGTSSLGLIGLHPDTGATTRVHLRRLVKGWQVDPKILSLHQDREGRIWMGTEKSGIFSYHRSTGAVQRYVMDTKEPGSPSDNTIFSILEDREGLLWFATGKGISLLNKQKFRIPLVRYDARFPGNLSDNNILAVYEDSEEILWISTSQGGLNIWNRRNNRWNSLPFSQEIINGFKQYPVRTFCEDSSGNLWLGNSKGLFLFERGKATITQVRNPKDDLFLPDKLDIKAMASAGDNHIWIATKTGGLFRWDTSSRRAQLYANEKKKNNMGMYTILDMYIDQSGGVWLATKWHGVDHFDSQTENWHHHVHKTGNVNTLPSATVYSITEDREGKIWLATESGPCYLDPETKEWHRLPGKIKLPDRCAYGILFDQSNGLWVSSKRGLIHINTSSYEWRLYGPEDGVQDLIFNPGVCFQSKRGEMYFGGVSGFNHFFPEKIFINSCPPPVAIASIRSTSENIPILFPDEKEVFRVTKKDLPLSVTIASLSYAFPKKNHYKVTILGDKPMIYYLGTRNIFYITDLQPGRSRFLIQGSNHDLVWNEKGMVLTLYLKPSNYLFFFLGGLLLLSLLVLFAWHRARQKKTRPILNIPSDISEITEKFRLTKREQEIIVMVLDGKSNKEIEEELYISLRTVKSHLYNVYRKLNIKNRLQLMNTIHHLINKHNSKRH